MPANEVVIRLSVDEYERLVFLVGYATGKAFDSGERELAYRFLDLANRVSRENPQWRPYHIPEEFRPEETA